MLEPEAHTWSAKTRDELVVVVMRSDPEPRDEITVDQTDNSPSDSDSRRVERLDTVNTFELQARMSRVLLPELVVLSPCCARAQAVCDTDRRSQS